jgi:hypothetical protein
MIVHRRYSEESRAGSRAGPYVYHIWLAPFSPLQSQFVSLSTLGAQTRVSTYLVLARGVLDTVALEMYSMTRSF